MPEHLYFKKPALSTESKKVTIKSVGSISGCSNFSRVDSIFLNIDVKGMAIEVLRAFVEKDLNIKSLGIEIAANQIW